MTLLDAALNLAERGCAVVPVRTDGSKAPAVDWKAYQQTPPDADLLDVWFGGDGTRDTFDGLGVITGAVSGGLEMVEVEGRAAHLAGELGRIMADHDLADLWQRLCSGWLEVSPSGGMHWLYRVLDDQGAPAARPNTKLARRRSPDNPRVVDVLIETRGEGGFTVTAPSAGRSHPTGRAWAIIAGGPATCPTITVDERDALYALAAMLDEMPTISAPTFAGGVPLPDTKGELHGERPGDDYNARATWADILEPAGWTRARKLGDGYGWTRPGKDSRLGISATTGTATDGVDRLYVFTTSTEFEAETPYSKFGAYALLHHNSDHAEAARTLRKAGYGAPLPERKLTLLSGIPGGAELEARIMSQIDEAVLGPQTGPSPQPAAPPGATSAAQAVDGATVHHLEPRPAAATLAHTDDANGLLLVQRYGDRIRHCDERGSWYAWDGRVWAPCARSAGPARELAKESARLLPEANEKDVAHKRKSLNAIGITNALSSAASDPRVAVRSADLDAHPWQLNTPGGIVDLQTGQILPADPAKLHTRLTLCTPEPDADPTVWQGFLDTTFGGDAALIEYLQRLVGYSAVGLVGAHVLPYCYGEGGNGKGAFLESCLQVLGDYGTTAPSGFLMAKQYQGHETEIARLDGARMVVTSEVNEGDRFDEAKVKQLTGGDTLTARFMARDHFTFTPSHQLWAMGNHQPHVASGGPSFWRRLRLIPFLHKVPESAIVDDLQSILAHDHGPALLAWIVEGAVKYAASGLSTPESVLAATGSYERDQDTVSRFLDEMCHVGGGQHVQVKVGLVRDAYEQWCRELGEAPVSAKAFGQALLRAGIGTTRTKTARLYVGMSLLNGGDDQPEERYT